MLLTHFACVCAISVVSAAAAACSKSGTAESRLAKDVKSEYDQTGRLTRLTYDRNGDGKIDAWGFMDGSRVVRVEVDENGDDTVDRWEYHTGSTGSRASTGSQSSTGAVDPTLERIDRSTKFDGVVNRHEYFDSGVLTRIEEDTDGDGKADKWETYSGGTLATMALDTKGRGTPDRRLIYQPDGTLSRIETDPNGTGTFQPLPQ